MIDPEQLTKLAAAFAAEKKAIEMVALDLRGVAGYTDFFVICQGNTPGRPRRSTTGSTSG